MDNEKSQVPKVGSTEWVQHLNELLDTSPAKEWLGSEEGKKYQQSLIGYPETAQKVMLWLASQGNVWAIDKLEDAIEKALEQGDSFNLGLKMKVVLEELCTLYDVDCRENALWQDTTNLVAARDEVVKRARALRSAKEAYELASKSYRDAWRTMIVPLALRGVHLYGGDDEDPDTWFWPAERVIEWAQRSLGWKSMTLSKLRYYTKLRLVSKSVRVGRGGKAFYSPLIRYRLQIIFKYLMHGSKLSEIPTDMSYDLLVTFNQMKLDSELPAFFHLMNPMADLIYKNAVGPVEHKTRQKRKKGKDLSHLDRESNDA